MTGPTAPHESRRRGHKRIQWELIACGWSGHALVGTDAADIGPEDQDLVREIGSARWCRCLRCDAWVVRPVPDPPARPHVPSREEIELPLRGRPLRDRIVLRLIAADRIIHIVVLGLLAAAVFVFATHRRSLHSKYTRLLNDLQTGLGGPVTNTSHGVFGELNKLFKISSTELYLIGAGLVVYCVLLGLEAVGLWYARRWAEYLTVIEAGVLVPYEVYELAIALTPLKVLTLVINVAIVVYLAVAHRLFGLRGGAAAVEEEYRRDSGWPALERTSPARA